MKIGLFPMVADVLHAGHVIAIQEAKSKCDYLIVALYCMPTTKTPVQSIFERYIQLDALGCVDKVIPYENKSDAYRMIASLQYDIYFLGSDYKNKDFEGKELLEELDKEVYYLSRNHTMSSSYLKDRITKRKNKDTKKSKIIAVDFDGCICTNNWPHIGEPNTKIIKALLDEQRRGSKLILWTCRCGNALQDAIEACKTWGIVFDAVNDNLPERLEQYDYSDSRKISADEYWDDLAVVADCNNINKEEEK